MGPPSPRGVSLKSVTKWRKFSLCEVVRDGRSVRLSEKGVRPSESTFAMFSYEEKHGKKVFEATTWNSVHCRIHADFEMSDVDRWSPELVRSVVACTVAANMFDLGTGSHIDNTKWIHDAVDATKDSRENIAFNSRPCRALREAQNAVGSAFGEFMDHSFKAAVSSVKECFKKYQGRLSEEDVVTWFREATVDHVMSQ